MKGSCNNSPPKTGKFLVFASTNQNKFFEIRTALGHTGIRLLALTEFPRIPEAPETGATFEENALQKARYYHSHLQKPVLAEDSGLVVPALDGFPGINSARIASDDRSRIEVVLQRLREFAAQNKPRDDSYRNAYYHCSIAVIVNGALLEDSGRCDGRIAEGPDGDLGFGYDPVFVPEGHARTFGRMSIKEKSEYSHRGRAIHAILPRLMEAWRTL